MDQPATTILVRQRTGARLGRDTRLASVLLTSAGFAGGDHSETSDAFSCQAAALRVVWSGADEGDGIAAAFGGEVATESEHVCPSGQAQVGEFGELAEAQAFADEPTGVLARESVSVAPALRV